MMFSLLHDSKAMFGWGKFKGKCKRKKLERKNIRKEKIKIKNKKF